MWVSSLSKAHYLTSHVHSSAMRTLLVFALLPVLLAASAAARGSKECMWHEYIKHDNVSAWEFQAQPHRHMIRDRDKAIKHVERILQDLTDDPESGVQFVPNSRWMAIFKETGFQLTSRHGHPIHRDPDDPKAQPFPWKGIGYLRLRNYQVLTPAGAYVPAAMSGMADLTFKMKKVDPDVGPGELQLPKTVGGAKITAKVENDMHCDHGRATMSPLFRPVSQTLNISKIANVKEYFPNLAEVTMLDENEPLPFMHEVYRAKIVWTVVYKGVVGEANLVIKYNTSFEDAVVARVPKNGELSLRIRREVAEATGTTGEEGKKKLYEALDALGEAMQVFRDKGWDGKTPGLPKKKDGGKSDKHHGCDCDCKSGCHCEHCGCDKDSSLSSLDNNSNKGCDCGCKCGCHCKHCDCKGATNSDRQDSNKGCDCGCKCGCHCKHCDCGKDSKSNSLDSGSNKGCDCGCKCGCHCKNCDCKEGSKGNSLDSDSNKGCGCGCKCGCDCKHCGCGKDSKGNSLDSGSNKGCDCGCKCGCHCKHCDCVKDSKGDSLDSGSNKGCDCGCKCGCHCKHCDCGKDSKGNSLDSGSNKGCDCGCKCGCHCKHRDCAKDSKGNSLDSGSNKGCDCGCKCGCHCKHCDCLKDSKGNSLDSGSNKGCDCGCKCGCHCKHCDCGKDSKANSLDSGSNKGCDCGCKCGCHCKHCDCVKDSKGNSLDSDSNKGCDCGCKCGCHCKHCDCKEGSKGNSLDSDSNKGCGCGCKCGCDCKHCDCKGSHRGLLPWLIAKTDSKSDCDCKCCDCGGVSWKDSSNKGCDCGCKCGCHCKHCDCQGSTGLLPWLLGKHHCDCKHCNCEEAETIDASNKGCGCGCKCGCHCKHCDCKHHDSSEDNSNNDSGCSCHCDCKHCDCGKHSVSGIIEHLPRPMLAPGSEATAVTAARQSAIAQQQQLASGLQDFIRTRSSLQDRWRASTQVLSRAVEAKQQATLGPASLVEVVHPAEAAGTEQHVFAGELGTAESDAGAIDAEQYILGDEYYMTDEHVLESWSEDVASDEAVSEPEFEQPEYDATFSGNGGSDEVIAYDYVEVDDGDRVVLYDAERDDWEGVDVSDGGVLMA